MMIGLVSVEGRAAQPADYPIRPVPFTAVHVDDVFWAPRMETNRKTTVWYDFQKCEETNRIANFEVAGGLKEGG
ncbi:MAG: glycoside hydrolase family 127 protein, partial [Planctomycetota bacterium]